MSFSPRDWQIRAKAAISKYWSALPPKGAMLVAGTGTGKTAGAHYILEDLLKSGMRVLWIAAQEELVTQPEQTLRKFFPSYTSGIVKGGEHAPHTQVVYASRATLARSPERLRDIIAYGVPAVVVIDECHEAASKSYRKIISQLRDAGVQLFLGLTATPERGDGNSLSSEWEMVFEYSILEAIADGCIVEPYLSMCKIPELDLSKVGVSRGDYATPELERELMRAHIVEHTVAAIGRLHDAVSLPFKDKRATFDPRDGGIIVHTVTVDQAKATAEALNAAGYTARAVWGGMAKGDRKRILAAFGKGIQILCSPAALAQGTDLPWASTSIIARPTRSHRLYVQQFGRVLRPFDGKKGGLTIDLVGSSDMHSLIGAPVLLDGDDCPNHSDGQHRYISTGDGGGWCECGRVIKCYRAGGGHFFKHGKCVHCNAPQCMESPTKNHVWVAWGDGKSKCQFCGHEIRDRLFTLTGASAVKEDVRWIPVAQDMYAVDLGKVGKMYNIRKGELWRPILVQAKNKVTPLSHGLVNQELARLLTDDVARQAAKSKGGYGAHVNQTQKAYGQVNLAALAKELNLRGV